MRNPVDPERLHKLLSELAQNDLDEKFRFIMKKFGYAARYKKDVFDALVLLEKEKVGGNHELLTRISGKKDFLKALKKEMLGSVPTQYEKVWANHAFEKMKLLVEDEYFKKDWTKLKNRWGFLYVPDVFYPGELSDKNELMWTNAFIEYFIKRGIAGAIEIFKDIGNILANYEIDCIYDGRPIYFYSLVYQVETKTDEFGRLTKIFKYPMRFITKEILQDTESFNRSLEARIYGENLELKHLGVFYKYSWGMKPTHKKGARKITRQLSYTEMFLHRGRNKIIKEKYNKLKQQGFSSKKCYEIIGNQVARSPMTIRQIIKGREKLA